MPSWISLTRLKRLALVVYILFISRQFDSICKGGVENLTRDEFLHEWMNNRKRSTCLYGM